MTIIALREPQLAAEVQEVAEREGVEATDFVAEAVRRHLAAYRQKRIIAETEAWYRLSSEERKRYEGKFVAVYGGQVVDSGMDRLELYLQVRERYGRRPILITKGGDHPIPIYNVRSPRRGEKDAN